MPGNFEDHKRGIEMPIESHRCLCQYGRANGASWARFGVGGAGYSIFPRHALTYLAADMGIQGEGEQSFVMLLDRLKNDDELSNIPGLYHAERGIANHSDTFNKGRTGKNSTIPIVASPSFQFLAPQYAVAVALRLRPVITFEYHTQNIHHETCHTSNSSTANQFIR